MSNKVKAWLGIGIGALIIVALFSTFISIRNTGIGLEEQLTAQYRSNQNELSRFVSGFYEQVDLAQTQGDVLNDIIAGAVTGRYGEDGFSADGAFFSAVFEAYPEASTERLLDNWGKIQDFVTSSRESFKNHQDKLLDMLRNYDTWRDTGIVRPFIAGSLFPSSHLEARIGDDILTGKDAKTRMERIIVISEVNKAFEDGTMDPLKVPKK